MNAQLDSARPLPRRISAPALRRALIAGARKVIAHRETLNRINVFPVPDGDTGSNLAFTLGHVLGGALSRPAGSPGELLGRVGEDAIDGARGNSGAILAQFLQGVAEAVGRDTVALDTRTLSLAVRNGAHSARAALSEPREGTILSVIHAFAEALEHTHDDLREWFGGALERTRAALANTPKQLAVLQKAGVVDAGAQGFVDLLEGIAEFIASRRVAAADAEADIAADFEAQSAHREACGDPDHRWCSECLLLGDAVAAPIDREGLRAEVLALGASCVVVAGSAARVRLHAHVADPQRLFEVCARFGRVEGCKADDMLAQQCAVASEGEGVAIVTDSSADLPAGLAERLHIHVVPLRINFGERDYLDKVSLSPGEFYAKLRGESVLPRTSQPPPGDFRRQFEFLLSHHPALVYVGLSRAVSGTLAVGRNRRRTRRCRAQPCLRQCQRRRRPGAAGDPRRRAGAGGRRLRRDRRRARTPASVDAHLGHRPRPQPWRAWRPRAALGQAVDRGAGHDAGGQGEAGRPARRGRRAVRPPSRARALRRLSGQAAAADALPADRRPLRQCRRRPGAARRIARAARLRRGLAGRDRPRRRRPCRPGRAGGVGAAGGGALTWQHRRCSRGVTAVVRRRPRAP